MEAINNRIKNEICDETINKLKDLSLIEDYKKCKSVKKEINKLEIILQKYDIDKKIKESVLDDYLLELIPAGTKGVIRGNKFNSIVKDTIIKLNLDSDKFEVCFEKKSEIVDTDEIPDWYILQKTTNKIIIGMNQLDLWGGGQQLNRGYKYLTSDKINNAKCKLLCVICNKIKFKNNKNKAYKLFEIGFANDTICYIKNLEQIIKKYFD